jgi:hypothetical protein
VTTIARVPDIGSSTILRYLDRRTCSVHGFVRMFSLKRAARIRDEVSMAYLNNPPMTEAKKIATPSKSNPVTIFLFRITLRRAMGLRG